MTINASTYFRPCDCEGGVVDVDMTLYLAPSASSQSPNGIAVGSDTTGDGSEALPFFSIKRAMEYLNDYRIKVGAYVIIRGLPGMYNYNETHAFEITHKDAKYIKVQFDMLNTGNYHMTSIDFSTAVTSIDNGYYDSVTFKVDSIGTDFYQLQVGDYIKIVPDNSYLHHSDVGIWAGYYPITAVDVINKLVTIKFRRHQISSSYNAGHTYKVPDTLSGVTVTVIKFSTHQYITYSTAGNDYFISSEFGFGSIQVNASDEYYNTHATGDRGCSYFGIYDGIINDVITHLNGFTFGVYFKNLECNFDLSSLYLYSMVTSCNHGYEVEQSTINLQGFIGNCCSYPLTTKDSIINHRTSGTKMCVSNNYNHGMAIASSTFYAGYSASAEDTINAYYNDRGIVIWVRSTLGGTGLNCQHNLVGLGVSDSEIRFFVNYDDSTIKSDFSHNTTGISMNFNAVVDISYSTIHNNNSYGIHLSENSTLLSTANIPVATASVFEITFNTDMGIFAEQNCYLNLYNGFVTYNGYGIVMQKNTQADLDEVSMSSSTTHDGLYIDQDSHANCSNVVISSNTGNGIRCLLNSSVHIVNPNTSPQHEITNNTANDIYVQYNSNALLRLHVLLTGSTIPAVNTAPVYTSANDTAANYIIEVNI